MTDRHLRHLPVVEDGQLLGLLSIGDLVKAAIAEQAELIQQLEQVHPRRLEAYMPALPFSPPAHAIIRGCSRCEPPPCPLRRRSAATFPPTAMPPWPSGWRPRASATVSSAKPSCRKQKALVRDHYLDASETWLALDGDTPLGFIGLLDAFIGGLFVAPAAHGRGIGRQLVEHAATLKGALEVEVYAANREALGFYALRLRRERPTPA